MNSETYKMIIAALRKAYENTVDLQNSALNDAAIDDALVDLYEDEKKELSRLIHFLEEHSENTRKAA